MGKKRGFFAELQHQAQQAERRQAREQQAAYRAQVAAARRAEQAKRQAELATAQIARALGVNQKEAERAARQLHMDAMQSEVDTLNATLAQSYAEIDSLLEATLDVDDFVDLERLRSLAEHPPFESQHERPSLPPPPLQTPTEPAYTPPSGEPGKVAGIFGGRKKFVEFEAEARRQFESTHAAWSAELAALPARQRMLDQQYQEVERQRLHRLAVDHERYKAECRDRERQAAEANEQLNLLIQGLAYGVEDAVQEYVAIVLSNSAYPESFPVDHEFTFDSQLKELTLTVVVPPPPQLPSVKEYKYVRAKDEITSASLPQKEVRDRYRDAVSQVAVRSLHEVFESDRVGRIQTIAVTVATDVTDAATGRERRVPLAAVAADRQTFSSFDLSKVVASATLEHLGAQVSKNPADLVPIDTSKGVRGR